MGTFVYHKHFFFFQKLDLNGESIELADSGNVTTVELPSKVPIDNARYHLFSFKHTHEGDYLESKSKGITTEFFTF